MTVRLKTVLTISALVASLAASYAVGVSNARQPAMRAALENLRQAKTNLQNASWNKDGHRAEAIRLTDLAIAEVNAGIAAGAD